MNKNLLPEQRKELLAAYRMLPDEERTEINQGLQALAAYYAFLWDRADNFEFASKNEKRHTLLVYKHLGLVWFNELPSRDNKPFTVIINQKIPETLTTDTILEIFRLDAKALEKMCIGVPRPRWVEGDTSFSFEDTLNI